MFSRGKRVFPAIGGGKEVLKKFGSAAASADAPPAASATVRFPLIYFE